MTHALIISDNLVISRAIRQRLVGLGFESFDFAWSRRQAVFAASCRHPDLIVTGDSIADDSPIEVAKSIALPRGLPVLHVSQGTVALEAVLPNGSTAEGPFALDQIDQALSAMTVQATDDAEARPPSHA